MSEALKDFLIEAKTYWRSLYWWKRAIGHWLLSLYYRRIKGNRGTFIVDEDWDNLVILDACRYDVLRNMMGKDIDFRISRGSSTPEFLVENFSHSRFDEIIYISANPQVNKYVNDAFFMLVSVWKNGWDDKYNTVLPDTLAQLVPKIERKYPNKRLIIHFMQPHIPFIGNPEFLYNKSQITRELIKYGITNIYPKNPWIEVDKGKIKFHEVWNAYRKNLKIVLPVALDLIEKLKGKTVITSDHGEAYAKLYFPFPIRIVGHPSGIYIPQLVKVPWLVFDNNGRKEIKKATEKDRVNAKISEMISRGHI